MAWTLLLPHPWSKLGPGPNQAPAKTSLMRTEPYDQHMPAGRYVKDKPCVDFNDEGALFLEARVDCELHQILNPPVNSEFSWLNNLLLEGVGEADDPTDPMLAVQLNKFQGSGLAIGMCVLYRIFDSYSMSMFLAAWYNDATGLNTIVKSDFDSTSIFPAEDAAPLYFEGIYSNILRTDMAKLWGRSRVAKVLQAANVRERIVPPVSKYTCGTWVSAFGFEYTTA
ncbi:limonoid 21-O-acetyltransferse-like [Primulina eburnea]|uniref:limonoid 21-O-acetyltransferse-like n=1 Tax=Primulina eburnea TaxID=1245227 RepID=UPI003C6C93B4